MIIPPYLQRGDTIAIAAPARKIAKEEIVAAQQLLVNRGFRVFFDERLFAEENQFAGSDEHRANYFQTLLNNPDVKAIWCARGGYGSVRIIDRLDFSYFMDNPKWICGYSDVTVFHSHLHSHGNVATLHATMPINIRGEEAENLANQSFVDALQGKALCYEIPSHPLNVPADLSAPVVGGNLSMLYSLLGSPSDVNTEGKILFLEDLDEYLYHIDRMMVNLERNGKLQKVAALLIGHLSDMHDNTIPFGKNAKEIVAQYARKYHIPVIFNFPAGHLPNNYAIRLGAPMRIQCKQDKIVIEN